MTVALPRTASAPIPARRVLTPVAPGGEAVRPVVNPILRGMFYLFVLSIPFELGERYALPIEVPTLTSALFLLAAFLQPSAAFRRVPSAVLWFTVYLWMFGLSTLVNQSDYPMSVLELGLQFVLLLLTLWVATNLLRDPFVMRGVLLTLAIACGLRAAMQIVGLGATTHAEWTGGVRTTFVGQNPNLSAIILSAGLVAAVNLRPRLLFLPLAGVMGAAIIQTGSRGGLLCTAVGLLVLLWQGHTPWAKARGVLLGIGMLGLLAFGAYRSDMLRSRFEQVATDRTLAGRERIYPAAIAMFSEKPVLGWGPVENQYEIAQRIGDRRRERRDAHNLLLELLSATGLLGAIPFLLGLALCVRGAWRGRRTPFRMLPLALLLTVLVGSISGTWIVSKVLWLTLAIALAAGAVAAEQRRCAV
jgi:O-antigen ligase